jgi:hypothetical protein
MSAIHIRKKIDSETITLPELRPFIGCTVEILILIQEAAPATARVIPESQEWQAIVAAAQSLEDYDYQAKIDQDARDIREAQERMM